MGTFCSDAHGNFMTSKETKAREVDVIVQDL